MPWKKLNGSWTLTDAAGAPLPSYSPEGDPQGAFGEQGIPPFAERPPGEFAEYALAAHEADPSASFSGGPQPSGGSGGGSAGGNSWTASNSVEPNIHLSAHHTSPSDPVKEKVHKFEDKVIELTQPAASTPFATSPALRYVADVDVSQKVGAIQTDGARPPLPASHYNVMQQLEKSVSVISRPVDSNTNSNFGQSYNPLTGPSVFEQEDFITPEASIPKDVFENVTENSEDPILVVDVLRSPDFFEATAPNPKEKDVTFTDKSTTLTYKPSFRSASSTHHPINAGDSGNGTCAPQAQSAPVSPLQQRRFRSGRFS